MVHKTGKPFIYRSQGYQQTGKPQQNVSQSRYTNKDSHISVQQEHCNTKPLASNFVIQVSELVHKIQFLNKNTRQVAF